MKDTTITFSLEKETKNFNRYQEVTASKDATPIVGTLYVSKSVLEAAEAAPAKVEVTIKAIA
jgi:hypothetical protein